MLGGARLLFENRNQRLSEHFTAWYGTLSSLTIICDVHLYFTDMGFRAGLVVQSSVCATYGAGLVTACVVDVGHSRTCISCVDDGTSLPASRRMAPYGFSDVGRLVGWLLRQTTYPYYFPPLTYHREEFVMQELIENHASIQY